MELSVAALPLSDYKALFEAAPGLFLVLRPDLSVAAASDAYLQATMTKREEILGRNIFDVFPDNPADKAATGVSNLNASFRRVLAARIGDALPVQKYDIRKPAAKGGTFEERYWSALNSPVLDKAGNVAYIIHRTEDVTKLVTLQEQDAEQARLNQSLRSLIIERTTIAAEMDRLLINLTRSNEELTCVNKILGLVVDNASIEAILGQALDLLFRVSWLGIEEKGAVLLTDPSGKNLNLKAQRGLTGQAERACAIRAGRCLCGSAALSGGAVLEEDPELGREAGGEGGKPHGYYCLPIKFKSRMEGVLALYVPGGYTNREGERSFLGIICNVLARIVEYKELEAGVFRLQKMEALGRAAGTIAHDFNNILTAIKGFNELALETADPGTKKFIQETAAGIENGTELVQQILAFSRSQPARMSALDLNAVITGMEKMLGVVLQKKVRLRLDLAPGLPAITANKNQLEQILVNLAANARDAMPEGGFFSISTLAVDPKAAGLCPPASDSSQRDVLLLVSDTGAGIPEDLQGRLFEPFFSTKPEGKGSGLGLSTVYSMVKLHKGEISVTSEAGKGTTFSICFPEAGVWPKDVPVRESEVREAGAAAK